MLAEKITGDNSPIEVYDMLDIMLLESMTDIFVNPMADPHYEYSQPRSFVNGVNALLKMNSFRVLLGYVKITNDSRNVMDAANTNLMHDIEISAFSFPIS